MDSTIAPIDKAATTVNQERQLESNNKAGDAPAGSAPNAGAKSPENVDTTVEAAVEATIDKNGRDLVFGGRSIQFSYDKKISRVIVKVSNMDSGELIRQIPPEDYLRFISRFKELVGVLFDETA